MGITPPTEFHLLIEQLELYHGQFRVYFRTLEGRVEATFTDAVASSEKTVQQLPHPGNGRETYWTANRS